MAAQPNLPVELIEHIVKELSDVGDYLLSSPSRLCTLTTLARVSLVFSVICRPYIFKMLLGGVSGKSKYRLLLLVERLQENPALMIHARTLRINLGIGDQLTFSVTPVSIMSKVETDRVQAILPCLPKLQSLEFYRYPNRSSNSSTSFEHEDTFQANLSLSLLSKGTLKSISVNGYPNSLPISTVLSCPSLDTLFISVPPSQWTDLSQSPLSSITHLTFDHAFNEDFDLTILDYFPQLESLEFADGSVIPSSSPHNDQHHLPSFNLKHLRFCLEYGGSSDAPLAPFVDYYLSRASSTGGRPFQKLKELYVTVMNIVECNSARAMLEHATSLDSLNIDLSTVNARVLLLPSFLDLGGLTQRTFHSLTCLFLSLMAHDDTHQTVLGDLLSNLFVISERNSLKSFGFWMYLSDVPGVPMTLANDILPLSRLLASPSAYPSLKEVDLGYEVFRNYQRGTPKMEMQKEQDTLRALLVEGIRDLRERGVKVDLFANIS
ncbi:hypothetical protein BJ165DRAFT_1518696 [Panaeolus papilionaceus]|nr:hypothetical protein BJ165DRAFT_1518696 [Panaeolus papilionaceus]